MRRQFAANLAERLVHLAQDVREAVLGLRQRLFEDFLRDAGDLDVHLHRGDAFGRARDLEIHVAEVVLVAQDVAEDREILAFEDQRSEEHTSELQSLMRISYAVFCLKKKNTRLKKI